MIIKLFFIIFMTFLLAVDFGCIQLTPKNNVKLFETKSADDLAEVDVKNKFKQWKKKLYAKDPTIKTAAAVSLLSLDYPDALILLKDILKDAKKKEITVSVLKAFGFTNDDRALVQIIALLDDENEEIKFAAAETLGKIKTVNAHKLMVFNLLNSQRSVESRVLIAQALGDVRNRDSVEPLAKMIQSGNQELQVAAENALEKITKQPIGKDVTRWKEWWDLNKVKSREEWLEEIVEDLEDTLKQAQAENAVLNNEIAKKSIELLVSSSNNSDIKVFLDAAKSKYSDVRVFAARELAKRKPPESVDIFSELLLDENLSVKVIAARTLGEIADKKTFDSLLEMVDVEADPEFQAEIIKALGKIGMASAVAPITSLLNSKTQSIKVLKASAEALGLIGDARAINYIIPFIDNEDASVREAITIALGKIKDGRSVGPLIKALSDKAERVRWYAADSLGKLKAKKAVGQLIKLLSDNSARVRESATTSLGQIGDEKAVDHLTKMLDDPDVRVVEQASEALLAIAGGELKALDNLSDIFFLKNDYNRATIVLEKQLARFSENEESLWNSRIKLAKSVALTGNWEKSVDLYSKLVEHFPENSEFKKELLHSMLELKQYEKSLDLLADWINGSYNHKDVFWKSRLDILTTLFNKGKYDKVKDLIDAFEKDDPELGGGKVKNEFVRLRKKSVAKIKKASLGYFNNLYEYRFKLVA